MENLIQNINFKFRKNNPSFSLHVKKKEKESMVPKCSNNLITAGFETYKSRKRLDLVCKCGYITNDLHPILCGHCGRFNKFFQITPTGQRGQLFTERQK